MMKRILRFPSSPQRLAALTTRKLSSTSNIAEGPKRLVYHGGYENILLILKRVSVFSCVCTLIGVPLLGLTSTNSRMKPVHRFAVTFVVVAFGVGTTIALFVVTKPYVVKMYLHPASKQYSMETLDAFGRMKTTFMDVEHLVPSSRPWATFENQTRPNERFFIEETPDSYNDQDFYQDMVKRLSLNVDKKNK